MKTLEQAGGRTNTQLGSSSASLGTSQVQAKKVVGESLANDVMNIVGKTGALVQTDNTLSVNAAKKIGTDNKTSLGIELNEISANTNYNDPVSLREAQVANETAYQKNGRKTFDNDDAQIAYDSSYHNVGATAVSNKNLALEKKALKLDADNIFSNATSMARIQASAGIQLNTDELNSLVSSMTAGDYFSKDDAHLALSQEVSAAFETKVDTGMANMLYGAGYDPDLGWSQEIAGNVFENNFSAWGTMTEKGEIKFNDDIGTDARKQILSEWNGFNTKASKIENNQLNVELGKYQVASEEYNKESSAGNVTPARMKNDNKLFTNKTRDLKNLTTAEKEKLVKDNLVREKNLIKANHVEASLSDSSDSVKGFTESGIEWTDENGVEQSLSGEFFTNQIKAKHSDYSDVMTNNKIGSPEYNKATNDAIMLEYKSGVKNPVIQNYEKGITGTGKLMSVDEVNKSIDIALKKQSSGTANSMLKNTAYTAALQEMKARYDSDVKNGTTDNFKSEADYILRVNQRLSTMRTSVFSRIDSGKFKTLWEGSSVLAQDKWFKNTQIDAGTSNALMFKFTAEGGSANATEDDIVEFISANTVEFSGSFTGAANSLGGFFTGGFVNDSSSGARMVDSEGASLNDTVYEDGMNNITSQYNENNPDSKIAVSDLRVTSLYNGEAGADNVQWVVSVMKNGNNIPLRNYNGDEMIKMAGWKSSIEKSSLSTGSYNDRLLQLKKNKEFVKKLDEAKAKEAIDNPPFKVIGNSTEEAKTVDVTKMSNDEIKELQKKIGVTADGQFGKKSKRALENFDSNTSIANQIDDMSTSQVNKLVEIESGGQDYSAHNKGSNAYGRYQFIPSTGYAYAKKVGYTGSNSPEAIREFMTPENQDKMFVELTKDNIKQLKNKNIPVSTFTLYAAHQQGVTGAEKILSGDIEKISPTIFKNIVSNMGYNTEEKSAINSMFKDKDMVKMVRDQWIAMWKKRTS